MNQMPPSRLGKPDTFTGAVKWRCWEEGIRLADVARAVGMKPQSLYARLSYGKRSKRALQPWQVTKIAEFLRLPKEHLHRLAAIHEGWQLQ